MVTRVSASADAHSRNAYPLQFRSEFIHVFNLANLNIPNPLVFAFRRGKAVAHSQVVTSTSTSSRQIQFGFQTLS